MPACYFVQSHRAPALVARLVATLKRSSPDAHVLVGHDPRHSALARDDLPDFAGVDLFHSRPPIERGRLSLLSPWFAAIERLERQGIDYDWLVYLSGQDYPTGPLPRFEAFLRGSGLDGFLSHWDAFAAETPWGRRRQGIRRYAYRYFDAPRATLPLLRVLRALNGVQPLLHVHLVYGPRVGLRALRTPFSAAFPCRAGKQWTTLARPCVEHVVARLRAEPALLDWYERTICPDESLVQTVLVNSGRFRLGNDDLRYMDFRGSRDGSPRTLTSADLPTLEDPRYFFARKFDLAADAAVLDRLDERILARQAGQPAAIAGD